MCTDETLFIWFYYLLLYLRSYVRFQTRIVVILYFYDRGFCFFSLFVWFAIQFSLLGSGSRISTVVCSWQTNLRYHKCQFVFRCLHVSQLHMAILHFTNNNARWFRWIHWHHSGRLFELRPYRILFVVIDC